jgi:hypothetical protein
MSDQRFEIRFSEYESVVLTTKLRHKKWLMRSVKSPKGPFVCDLYTTAYCMGFTRTIQVATERLLLQYFYLNKLELRTKTGGWVRGCGHRFLEVYLHRLVGCVQRVMLI